MANRFGRIYALFTRTARTILANTSFFSLTFFRAPEEKDFPFFSCGATPSRTVPKNPAPAGCLFSTRKSRSEVPARGDFGEEDCVGKGGVKRAKKGKKDAQKKGGFNTTQFIPKTTLCNVTVLCAAVILIQSPSLENNYEM